MAAREIVPGVDQLKALTHPVRVRMLGLLRVDGPATATTLATRLGINSGATSYHLRQLAQHGFIEDDESRGNGRERWWKAVHQATVTGESSVPDTPEGHETLDAYLQTVVTIYAQRLQEGIERRSSLPQEWREAFGLNDRVVRVTPAQATELEAQVNELIDGLEHDAVGEAVMFQFHVLPQPGPDQER
ncbi:ArsR family transcriptional regulator [Nocardioides albertanoniae]|uniref:ArsR family transcriptional regulator n=1 Tax=Nocardioides albertanoniae TaxID=1175486 RepID=A0A543A1U7_9ACTN|nr:transcriptional regulator [Nocardioides albertanoniae]TQL66559.1 ArsR family transcriptional regulator [Nocardioides albertanoniae]